MVYSDVSTTQKYVSVGTAMMERALSTPVGFQADAAD